MHPFEGILELRCRSRLLIRRKHISMDAIMLMLFCTNNRWEGVGFIHDDIQDGGGCMGSLVGIRLPRPRPPFFEAIIGI